jgi:hypothetical protein
MARSIQSPGVELREIDFTLRPASQEGTTIFVAGFADQGPIDEVLQPTSVAEFETVYGTPTNAAEHYFYQSVKAIINNSPGRVLTTRLPYGYGKGEGFYNWRYSALAYPANSFRGSSTSVQTAQKQNVTISITDTTTGPASGNTFATLRALSGLQVGLCNTGSGVGQPVQVGFAIDGEPAVLNIPGFTANTKVINLSQSPTNNSPAEVGVIVQNFFESDPLLSQFYTCTLTDITPYSITISFENKTSGPTDLVGQATRIASVTGSVLAVSVIPGRAESSVAIGGGTSVTSTEGFSGGNAYFFGKPSFIELTQEQYNALLTENIDWANRPVNPNKNVPLTFDTIGNAGLIILNKAQVSINGTYEGYYVGIIDNNNYNVATPYNGIRTIESIQNNSFGTTDYVTIPSTRLNFGLSAVSNGDGNTISEVMENLNDYDLDSRNYDDTITLGVFKLRKSVYTPDTLTLDYVLSEKYVGSLDYHRQIQDQNGGPAKPFYIGELAESSKNIKVLVNPWISNKYDNPWANNQGNPSKKVRFLSTQLQTPFAIPGFTDSYNSYFTRVGAPSAQVAQYNSVAGTTEALYPIGVYSNTIVTDKTIGLLPKKLERALDLVENSDIYPINIAVEAGLGTIFVNALMQSSNLAEVDYEETGAFIDNKPLPGLSALYTTNADNLDAVGTNIRSNYNAIANPLVSFAEKRRKDLIVILDPLRNIFVQGQNTKITSTKKLFSPNAGLSPDPSRAGLVTTNFSQHIYWPLRHQFGSINSSYATTYANVAQVIDTNTNRQIWIPFSGFAAAAMANTDFNFNPWQAPAGFTRGVITGINDLGVYPRQNQRDQLYKIALNPVTFFPGEGFVIFGQKTTLKKPSAFDRINVRRLFIALETQVKNTMKYFVFEPNTLFTRTQVINTLTPIFDNAKNTEGLYDYLIVCDERNNTPDVIDNNELKVDIYVKPVRTAEFILVSFYATRTGQDFQELIGG